MSYASSSWCLNELVKILECKESEKQIVWPVFYHVNPSEVRNQTGRYGEALAKHEVNKTKVDVWREALRTVANLSGWHLETGNEANFINSIVEATLRILNRKSLYVARYPVGLDSRVNAMNSLLDSSSGSVVMVGIYGIPGIGKTTVAKAVYNQIAYQFDGCVFLPNVKEASKQFHGLEQLQEMLLSEILALQNVKIGNFDQGINIIRDRLKSKKVLTVLDDVDDSKQLEALAGDRGWFGLGSRIITTTQDRQILTSHEFDELYQADGLNHDEALELLNSHAFKEKNHVEEFVELMERAVGYAEGLPLALEIFGSFLCGLNRCEWIDALDKIAKLSHPNIFKILKISYDTLDIHDQAIFLHIACFLNGRTTHNIKKILEACDVSHGVIGIKRLADKSLVTIDASGILHMHDLMQKIGQQIVRNESSEPGERSRLCHQEEIEYVLTKNTVMNTFV